MVRFISHRSPKQCHCTTLALGAFIVSGLWLFLDELQLAFSSRTNFILKTFFEPLVKRTTIHSISFQVLLKAPYTCHRS